MQDVERRTTEGFLRGTARLAGLDGDRGSTLALAFQNEYAAGWRDGEVVATTPDIICTMDSESGEAVGTEMLRYGQRISVIALPAPELFLTPKGLATVGPRAFGYDFDYKSRCHPERSEGPLRQQERSLAALGMTAGPGAQPVAAFCSSRFCSDMP